MAKYDDLDVPQISLSVGAFVVAMVISVAVLQVLYYHYVEFERLDKQVNVTRTASEEVIEAQKAQISQYGWVNKSEQVAAIPIAEAKSRVVAELKSE